MSEQIATWVKREDGRWDLLIDRGTHKQTAASVWSNGIWHTFDENGSGGENDQESTVRRAMIEAAASAIAQGFI